MAWWAALRARLVAALAPGKVEQRIDEEIRFHLEMLEDRLVDHGTPAVSAHHQARQMFGDKQTIKKRCADVLGLPTRPHRRKGIADMFFHDFRFALRNLSRRPGFTVVAVLTLALGIGANTAIFSLVNGVLLRALPYEDPEDLVVPATALLDQGGVLSVVSHRDYLVWREQTEVFEYLAAIERRVYDLTGDGEPERITGTMVSEDFFTLFRAQPLLGRLFVEDDYAAGNAEVVVLSDGFWRRRYGADPEIVGREIRLDDEPYVVLGVVEESRVWPRDSEAWLPMFYGDPMPGWMREWDNSWLTTVARLQPGVEIERARAVLTAIAERIAREMPSERSDYGAGVVYLHEWIVGDTIETALLVLLGAVGFVLLIACVNVANLLIARAAEREHEIAVRRALGASRGDLLRQLLAESVLLAALGAAGGILLARWGIGFLLASIPEDVMRLDQVELNGTVLLFVTAVTGMSALIFGIAPSAFATRGELTDSLKEAGRGFIGRRAALRARGALVVAEVTLSLMLLVGAGLMIRSLVAVMERDPGVRTEDLLTLGIRLPFARYPEKEMVDQFFLDVADRIDQIPGVVSSTSFMSTPLGAATTTLWRAHLEEGAPEPPVGAEYNAQWNTVMPGFFRTMGVPILQGRAFTERDDLDSEPVMVVSRSFAEQMFPDRDPIGKRVRSWRDENLLRTIVGVAGDVRQRGMARSISNVIYVPKMQQRFLQPRVIAVFTSVDPLSLVPAIRGEIWNLDSDLPITDIQTLEQAAAASISGERLITQLLGVFAAVALLMAAVGLYGLISYSVTQRRREIGLRMALGAATRDVLGQVFRHALFLTSIGIVLGLAAALALSHVMASLIYDISARDPITYIGVALVLAAVAVAASLVPALRATKVDPVTALRFE